MADLPKPGYLVVEIREEGACVGGLMVTDENGLPLDFRLTDPITPTRLQRALYGGALERYLRADVVAGTLLSSIEAKPTVIFVDEDDLLRLPDAPCPVASVDTTQLPPIGPVGTSKGERGTHALLQINDHGAPVRVKVADEASIGPVSDALVALGGFMDVSEPADRVRDALNLIASGELS